MSLTFEQVQRIAHLARIEISESEAATTQGHLNGIFRLIEQMQAVDTRGIEPMAHAQDLSQRLRDVERFKWQASAIGAAAGFVGGLLWELLISRVL